ncbi:MAG: Helicase c2 [Polaromonas sp.]|nr:Helicase c2 [Polaromonas sp.]
MTYTVAVRALCEFTAKQGDLDLRFTPSPSAQEGIAGHTLVVSRRGSNYQREVGLSGQYKDLLVRGRADGYDPDSNQLEEVKTYRGDLHGIAENRRQLHWAQAKMYGWLLCRDKNLDNITLALVYLDLASLNETVLSHEFPALELKQHFEAHCELFLVWARQEAEHRLARDSALQGLAFPHAGFRPGQRELAEAVYRNTRAGKCLMAQATTGIGKTMGTVFPVLKAAPRQGLDKLFFLAAKTPGRQLALDALALITGSAPTLPLRVLELVARDKSCEHPEKACHGDSCPLAKGFYDRLPDARRAAVAATGGARLLSRAQWREVALAHQVCPYYLSQEMVRWSDVVVGDYNYYFDSSALLYNLTTTSQWRASVLVDEAHNLVDRARSMYSSTLDQRRLHAVHAAAPKAVKKPLERLDRALSEAHSTQTQTYAVYAEVPVNLAKALQQASTAITDFLIANPTRVDAALQDFYFEVLQFSRLAESFAAHSIFDITLHDGASQGAADEAAPSLQLGFSAHPAAAGSAGGLGGTGSASLTIRNVVPAPFLAPRFAAAQSVTLFSATLGPQHFYRDTLGLPANSAWVDVPSPFRPDQLGVVAVTDLSTRFQHRQGSLHAIVELMARQYRQQPGNYLAFLSSYDYLQQLIRLLRKNYPDIPAWEQTRQMDEAGRDQFLARFTPTSRGIGFAVLGGAFAEGVDLPGRRLIGAFIATLGLPQVNCVNEEIRQRMATYFEAETSAARLGTDDSKAAGDPLPDSLAPPSPRSTPSAPQDKGYNYTYLYPGLQKVVQAAGRVIRTPTDQGVIYLMDDRFTRTDIQRLLPSWWAVSSLPARHAGLDVMALQIAEEPAGSTVSAPQQPGSRAAKAG